MHGRSFNENPAENGGGKTVEVLMLSGKSSSLIIKMLFLIKAKLGANFHHCWSENTQNQISS